MEEIRSWWEVPCIAHFCSLFRAAFGLTDFEIEDLEEALLIDGANEEGYNRFLADLHARLLRGFYKNIKDIPAQDFESYLSPILKLRWEDELGRKNPLGDKKYWELSTREKVEILHDLCDFRLEVDDVADLLKGLDADSLRVEPLGRDAEGSTFWYFYGTRLYKEEKGEERKTKKKIKKKKKTEGKKKRSKFKGKKKKSKNSSSESESDISSSSSEETSEDEESEERECSEDQQSRCNWSLACATAEEWEQLAELYSKSKNRDEKLLHETLSMDFVPEIPKMIEAKEKALQKKLLDMAPRRVSERIALKTLTRDDEDDDDEESQKAQERRRLADEKKQEEEERQREKQKLADQRLKERADRARLRKERQELEMMIANGEQVDPELVLSLRKEEASRDLEDKAKEKQVTEKKEIIPGLDESDQDDDLYTGMYKVLEGLKKHNNAWPFLEPVDESYAPQYSEIVENPMDLSTIEQKLDDSKYKTLDEFVADMKLMFENCMEYNGPDSMYTKMANTLEAALNRQIKKHFPEEEDNSDEDFEEELARSFRKREKGKKRQPSDFVPVGTEFAAQELLQQQRQRGFPMPQAGPGSMSAMFGNRMPMNHMNGGMMTSRGPSGLPFHPGMYFSPDGRPMYPPQFYQNAYSQQQQAYAHYQQQLQSQHMQNQQLRYGPPRNSPMGQHGPMHAGFPQGLSERMPFGAGMEEMSRRQGENDHRSVLHQHRPISTTGEPTPSPLTGASERREPEEPGNPNFRPQSFNQPFPHQSLYPQGSMPYRGPGEQFGPGQERMTGRDPWFNERAHPMNMGLPPPLKRPNPSLQEREFAPAVSSSSAGGPGEQRARYPFLVNNMLHAGRPEAGGQEEQPEHNKPSDGDSKEEGTGKEKLPERRGHESLSIKHILGDTSGPPRQDHARLKEAEGPSQKPQERAQIPPPLVPSASSSLSISNLIGERSGSLENDGSRKEGALHSPQEKPSKVAAVREGSPQGEHKGGLEPEKSLGESHPDVEKGALYAAKARYGLNPAMEGMFKNWPAGSTLGQRPRSFLEELNGAGLPMGRPGFDSDKAHAQEENNKLPFTSRLKELAPNYPSSAEDRAMPNQEPTKNQRTNEMHFDRNFSQEGHPMGASQFVSRNMGSPGKEKPPQPRPDEMAAVRAQFDPYASMHAGKNTAGHVPPALQYRPKPGGQKMSSFGHHGDAAPAQMQGGGAEGQFIDLDSMQYRRAAGGAGYPPQMYQFLERRQQQQQQQQQQQHQQQQHQQQQQMVSPMGHMQPGQMMGLGSMLRQQQLFEAAYASHMRNGNNFPGPSPEDGGVPSKMPRYS